MRSFAIYWSTGPNPAGKLWPMWMPVRPVWPNIWFFWRMQELSVQMLSLGSDTDVHPGIQ